MSTPTPLPQMPRSMPCPHGCGARFSEQHVRDTGDLSREEAIALGYCPKLVDRRLAGLAARDASAVPA